MRIGKEGQWQGEVVILRSEKGSPMSFWKRKGRKAMLMLTTSLILLQWCQQGKNRCSVAFDTFLRKDKKPICIGRAMSVATVTKD